MMHIAGTSKLAALWARGGNVAIAIITTASICAHLLLRFGFHTGPTAYSLPLWTALAVGGIPLVIELLTKVVRLQFGSDLLAGISIVTAALLHEYLAGAIVVLMLSGGAALENCAVRSASSVLRALARRMPSLAQRRKDSQIQDVALSELVVGDTLVIFPHDICPVDGIVTEGHRVMDESYLTGEPFRMSKTPGSEVISGAINGASALTIRATRPAADSRYARIMQVMQSAEKNRPRLRRLGEHARDTKRSLPAATRTLQTISTENGGSQVIRPALPHAYHGDSNRPLGQGLAREMGVKLSAAEVSAFAESEMRVVIAAVVRDAALMIIQSTCPPASRNRCGDSPLAHVQRNSVGDGAGAIGIVWNKVHRC